MKKKVAIVYGGYSSESETSKKSALTLFKNIDLKLFEPYLVEIGKDSWHIDDNGTILPINKNNFSFQIKNKEQTFDVAHITIHGTPGEDGKLPAYFDMIGLRYTNSSSFSAALSFNKWACNVFLRQFGISTAKSIVLKKGEGYNIDEIAMELGFPCFVKPNDGGSSYGISKVSAAQDIPDAITSAFAEGREVIIESFIAGREFTCGLYSIGDNITTLPPTEIISENDFFDHEAKYQGKSKEITPAEISEEQTKEMQEIAKKAFIKLGLSGIARIDFMLKPDGTFYIIEVNTNPGMTSESIIPQQLKADGKMLQKLLTDLINKTVENLSQKRA